MISTDCYRTAKIRQQEIQHLMVDLAIGRDKDGKRTLSSLRFFSLGSQPALGQKQGILYALACGLPPDTLRVQGCGQALIAR
jgi:hypothetical protein